MIGHHQTADPVGRRQVRGPPGQSHLDAGGAPGNEAGQFPLPDPLETFVHLPESQSERVRGLTAVGQPATEDGGGPRCYLGGVHLSLDDVEDGDVAVARLPLPPRGHHHVLGLQEPPHHIQHCGLPHASNLRQSSVNPIYNTTTVEKTKTKTSTVTHRLVSGQRCVAGHEEVEAGCRDEGRNEADQVVVHVAGVAQGGCARRHDGGNLGGP